MHTLKRALLTALILAAALVVPSKTYAQKTGPIYVDYDSSGGAIAAVSTDVAFLVKYVGTAASGLVAVDATTGDITFTEGAAGAEAATATFECPVTGALGGIIDVSNAACDTMGEVVDVINRNAGGTAAETGWAAVPIDAFRSDDMDVTSGALITLSATQAKVTGGLAVLWDSTTTFINTIALLPSAYRSKIETYYTQNQSGTKRFYPPQQLYAGDLNLLAWAENTTYSSGTSTLTLDSIEMAGPGGDYPATGETLTRVFTATGGASTVAATPLSSLPGGLWLPKNRKAVARIVNSAVMSAATNYATALRWYRASASSQPH